MFASLKKIFKWNPIKSTESIKNEKSLLLVAFIGVLEDVLFWRYIWLSMSFIALVNVIFFVCVHRQVNFLGFILSLFIVSMVIDAFEAWLKFKHRTTCLKRLANYDGVHLNAVANKLYHWLSRKWIEFVYLRETNHTKAFLLINIIFGIILLLGKYINGYLIIYIITMFICISYKIVPPIFKICRKIKEGIESDCELEGLIPDVSEVDIKLLSIEAEQNQIIDERQSLDYWKPDDIPLGEASDSSDNSSSLETNLSMEKIQTLQKDVETSDSSEDEYIPLVQQKEQLQSTLEVTEPASTWSSSAYNAFWNITGAVTNMISTDTKRKRVSSIDSSDGFEMIDKNDLH